MNTTLSSKKYAFIFGAPVLCVVVLIFLAKSTLFQQYPAELSVGITIDFLITLPLLFFLLIRKTKIPKIFVVSLTILGMLLASYLIPSEHQEILGYFKTWGLPILELLVFSIVGYKIVKAATYYRSQSKVGFDFYTILKMKCEAIAPKGIASILISELAVLYFGLLSWKKRALKNNEFSYHKDSGTPTLLIALIFIIGIETFVLHILLAKWNTTVAIVLTGLSIYTALQLFGFMKSMAKRPIAVTSNELLLRYGIMGEATIPLKQIDTLTLSTKSLEEHPMNRKLSFLGDMEQHNVIIQLKYTNSLKGLYGSTKEYRTLAFYVDDPKGFRNHLLEVLSKTSA